jgi:hypothetical protein
MFEILQNIQILWQNNQITTEQKDKIVSLLKDEIAENEDTGGELYNLFRTIKHSVDVDFRDIVYTTMQLIN